MTPTLRFIGMAAAILLALTGCAGPRNPIEVSVKQVSGDITFGAPTAAPVAVGARGPAPRLNPTPLGFPTIGQPAPPLPVAPSARPAAPTAPPTLDPCPAANRLQAAVRPATNSISGPPAQVLLPYRNEGVAEVTENGKTQKVAYPTLTQRRVSSARNPDDTYGFSVAEDLSGTTTTTTYFVDPKAGLYITGIVTTLPDGSSDSFVPVNPRSLMLLPLPVTPAAFSSVGVDPLSQTSVSFDGKVSGKVRVDACGIPLDAWEVKVTNGRTTSPGKQLDFVASYAIGTQYGGLSLRDDLQIGCLTDVSVDCDNGRRLAARNVATTNTEPELARKP